MPHCLEFPLVFRLMLIIRIVCYSSPATSSPSSTLHLDPQFVVLAQCTFIQTVCITARVSLLVPFHMQAMTDDWNFNPDATGFPLISREVSIQQQHAEHNQTTPCCYTVSTPCFTARMACWRLPWVLLLCPSSWARLWGAPMALWHPVDLNGDPSAHGKDAGLGSSHLEGRGPGNNVLHHVHVPLPDGFWPPAPGAGEQ